MDEKLSPDSLTPPPESTSNRLDQKKRGFVEDPLLTEELKAISSNLELQAQYEDIIVNGNNERLKRKSSEQVKELEDIYFGSSFSSEATTREQKVAKLKLFEDFVSSLKLVRNDEDREVYKSPASTGEVKSYGPLDVAARAEDYVYCSFDKMGHLMSRNGRRINEDDAKERGQIVMNDVANVTARTEAGQSIMKKYLINTFDYENGKKILALYMATVFETPGQAEYMLASGGGSPMAAQRWDSVGVLHYRDVDFVPKSDDDFIAQEERNKSLTEQFTTNMKQLLSETGIEPPLSLEVRIRDSARRAS